MEDYSVFPADGKPSQHAVNFIPGDTRDCGNPPYFMTLRSELLPSGHFIDVVLVVLFVFGY